MDISARIRVIVARVLVEEMVNAGIVLRFRVQNRARVRVKAAAELMRIIGVGVVIAESPHIHLVLGPMRFISAR